MKRVNSLQKRSIRVLLPLLFSAAVTLCVLVMIVIFSRYASERIRSFLKEKADQQVQMISESIEQEVYQAIDLSNLAYYRILKPYDFQNSTAELEQFYEQHTEELADLAVYAQDGRCLWSALPAKDEPVTQQEWHQNALQKIEAIYFGAPHVQKISDGILNQFEKVLTVSRYVELTDRGRTFAGVLRFDLRLQTVASILSAYDGSSADYCYLLDRDGAVLFHPHEKKLQSGLAEDWTTGQLPQRQGCETVAHGGADWLLCTRSIGYTGWQVVSVSSIDAAMQQNAGIYQGIWAILCIVGLILIGLDIVLIHQITRPVLQLSRVMILFGLGKLDVRAPEQGIGEIRGLAVRFNDMARKTRELMDSVVKTEQEKRTAERKMLQSQITPHFLYNTLDSIIWMIQNGQYEGAGKMVSSLAKFFRISLSQGKDIIPLGKELEHAVSYLSIQNIRFQDKFTFEVHADPALMEYLCPKLTIQPLLENAVYHGMEGMYDDGEISIRIYEKENRICIDVSDNGEGMTQEQIEYILHHQVVSGKRGSGIGVHNVDERIKLFFGSSYGVALLSSPDEGTTARITIPKVRDDGEANQEVCADRTGISAGGDGGGKGNTVL